MYRMNARGMVRVRRSALGVCAPVRAGEQMGIERAAPGLPILELDCTACWKCRVRITVDADCVLLARG